MHLRKCISNLTLCKNQTLTFVYGRVTLLCLSFNLPAMLVITAVMQKLATVYNQNNGLQRTVDHNNNKKYLLSFYEH
jgi:hypothetical protein